jgi:hypothetical protein
MKVSSEKLYKLCFTKHHHDDQVKEEEIGVACSTRDREVKEGKHQGKVSLNRAGSRRVGNIKIHLKETGRRWTGFTWFRIWINDELL